MENVTDDDAGVDATIPGPRMLFWWCCCDEADVDLFCGTHGDPEEELELDGNGGVGGGTAICTVTALGNGIVVVIVVGSVVGECSRSEWSCCCMAIT